MQKFKTSATPAEISYRQIVQGFINPLKCAYQSINGFSVDYVICWSTARGAVPWPFAQFAMDEVRKNFGERAREKFDGRRKLRNNGKVHVKTYRTTMVSPK